jgi:uncharacterized protein (DUF1697 family)
LWRSDVTDNVETKNFHVALLRAVNVGGKNRLPMKVLAEIFSEAGAEDVQTYIQSGNVVFQATPALAARLPSVVAAAISTRFGFEVPVIMRSATEFRRLARENPFLGDDADTSKLHVAFLADWPDAARVDALDPGPASHDELEVRGSEVYLHCPNGMGRSKLTTGYLDSRLATTSTIRNWRTVMKLVEMLPGYG